MGEENKLKTCPKCRESISEKAKKCPYCRSDLRNFFEKHPIIVAILVLFAIGYLFPSNNESNNENIKQDSSDIIKNVSNGDNTNKIDNDQYLRTRYAHTNINIRKGPSTDTKVITTIGKGTEVQIGATEDGWAPVYLNGTKEGYIYAKLLKMYPPPKIEVTSFSWYKDPSF
ncbi:SH3 domain-containing protein [Flexistipes sinusarabici]|nr:SH3 domain-containing protein [Flexistipes sinusarabici]